MAPLMVESATNRRARGEYAERIELCKLFLEAPSGLNALLLSMAVAKKMNHQNQQNKTEKTGAQVHPLELGETNFEDEDPKPPINAEELVKT